MSKWRKPLAAVAWLFLVLGLAWDAHRNDVSNRHLVAAVRQESQLRTESECADLRKVHDAAEKLIHIRVGQTPLPPDTPPWFFQYLGALNVSLGQAYTQADDILNTLQCK